MTTDKFGQDMDPAMGGGKGKMPMKPMSKPGKQKMMPKKSMPMPRPSRSTTGRRSGRK